MKAGSEPKDGRIVGILIAEDSEDSRFLLQEFLKRGPYDVTFARNGKIALEVAQSDPFDLILMDIQMPVMDGLTATRLLRKWEREEGRAPIPLLALTANARKADIELSKEAGCTAHVLKPISKQQLLDTVQKYAPSAAPLAKLSVSDINISPDFREAAKRYIQLRRTEVHHLIQLVETEEFEQVRILAREMKGTGTSYGHPDLTRLGSLLELSANDRNVGELSGQLLELTRYVQDAETMVPVEGKEPVSI